ncbi:MAG TPA: carbohydrate-binding protein [Tepidisphaeraceae bacterium]|nr:carbohydrate-binding protein [Tepidisphaeraceae bacterium]
MPYFRRQQAEHGSRALARAAGQWFETLESRRLFSGFAANISFEPANAPVPTGYLADTGMDYGDRGNGFTYGWNGTHAAQVVARHPKKPSDGMDNLEDTFAAMHPKGNASQWQIAVPDGNYQISITAGDPSQSSGEYAIDVNGAAFLTGKVKGRAARWITASNEVAVTDGLLTLTVPKNRQAKIDFIGISQIVPPPVVTPPPTPPPVVTPTPTEAPFTGTAFSTGQAIPFAQYDLGGQGLGFNVATTTNPGNDAYRAPDPVGIDTGGTTGNVIAETTAGEWLNYTIDVATAGAYALSASVSNAAAGGSFHAVVGGADVTGALTVPNTGDPTVFATVTSGAFNLAAGTQTIGIYFDAIASNGTAGDFDTFTLAPPVVTPPPTNPVPVAETPFLGTAFTDSENIPFADYDFGGEGVAFHDTTATNLGNDDLRDPDAVDIEAGGNTSGDVVGFTAAGEWLNYSVNIATAGDYQFTGSVANTAAGGSIHVVVNGSDVTGAIAIPNTGSFTAYQTITSNAFNVSAGVAVVRVSFDTASSNGALGNFDYFQLVPASTVPTTTEAPYLAAFTTNETIPAVQYDKGGEGVAYHDTTTANLGGDNYRGSDGVDIQAGGATGNVVAYVAAGEWLNYTINIATAGNYVLDASVANPESGGSFHAEVAGANLTGALAIPATADFTTYATVTSSSFFLSAGTQVLHVAMDAAAKNGGVANFDWFQIEPAPTTPTLQVQPLVWTTAHNANEGLAEAKSVGVNGLLYVFGGYFTTTPEYQATTSSEAYNPATDQWTELAPLPVPTTHMGIATDGTYIYIVGGYLYDPKTTYQTFGTTNSWRYDIATNTWSAFVPLPAARGAGGMELLDGYLHFFDGLAPPNKTPESDHWMLDLSSADPQWVTAAPTPFSRNHFSSAVLDGKIYLMGGRSLGDDLADPSAECITWDPTNPDVWTPIASLPQIRALAVSAVIDGYIFLAGGTTTSYTPINTVIMYDPTTNTWSNQTPIPAQRLAPCGGAVGNLLVVTTGLSQTLQSTTWVAKVSV